jgi:hypothetical protein
MNLQLDANTGRRHEEHQGLWRDGRLWWLNCLAIEAGWMLRSEDLPAARRRRDAVLAQLVEDFG